MRIDRIKSLLNQRFPNLVHLDVVDESHNHSGRQGQESHFKVLLVSNIFIGQSRVQRQRSLNELLAGEFEQGLHALTMRLLTPDEFEKQRSQFESPQCHSKQSKL